MIALKFDKFKSQIQANIKYLKIQTSTNSETISIFALNIFQQSFRMST